MKDEFLSVDKGQNENARKANNDGDLRHAI